MEQQHIFKAEIISSLFRVNFWEFLSQRIRCWLELLLSFATTTNEAFPYLIKSVLYDFIFSFIGLKNGR